MGAHQDPSFWQTLLDSRFIQALGTAFITGAAIGLAVKAFLKRQKPETKEDAEVKANIETAVWKQVAHQLDALQKDLTEVRERVSAIEGYLRRDNGVS